MLTRMHTRRVAVSSIVSLSAAIVALGCDASSEPYDDAPEYAPLPDAEPAPVIADVEGYFDGETFHLERVVAAPGVSDELGVTTAELTEILDSGVFGTGMTAPGTEYVALEQVARHSVTPGFAPTGDWAANVASCGPVPTGSESGVCVQIRMRNLFAGFEVIHGHVFLTSLTANGSTTSVAVPPPAPTNDTSPVDPFYISGSPAGNGLWRYGAVPRSTPPGAGPERAWVFRGTTAPGTRFTFSFAAQVRGDLVRPISRADLVAGSTDNPPAYGSGTPGNAPASAGRVGIDPTGRYVFFTSSATNLVGGAASAVERVYRKDMDTGAIILVSATATGAVPQDCGSRNPSAAPDGFWVAFETDCPLVATDTNGVSDIYLRDVRRVGPVLITNAFQSTAAANGPSTNPSYAPPFIVYESYATNLSSVTPPPGRVARDVYFRNTGNSAALPVSLVNRQVFYDADSFVAAVASAGGNAHIVLNTAATNAVAGDTNGVSDAILFVTPNGWNGVRQRISVSESGTQLTAASLATSISANGRFVAWQTGAAGLLGGASAQQVYVSDVSTGPAAVERVSADASGAPGNAASRSGVLSPDGRFVAYESDATNLLATPPSTPQIYFVDRGAIDARYGRPFLVSATESFSPSAGSLGGLGAIDLEGNYMAFSSTASLVPGASGLRVYRAPLRDLRDQ